MVVSSFLKIFFAAAIRCASFCRTAHNRALRPGFVAVICCGLLHCPKRLAHARPSLRKLAPIVLAIEKIGAYYVVVTSRNDNKVPLTCDRQGPIFSALTSLKPEQ